MAVTRDQIVAAIHDMGVHPGDLLIAHSSFKSFAGVDGGPEAVAHALIDTVSPGGSVFMPTFNFGELTYDSKATRSLTGAITEAFRLLPDVVRSDHPTHALAGFGPLAMEILHDHLPMNVFGRGSPLWRLWERDASVLLIGCDHRSNSMIHVAEELVGVPYIARTRCGRVLRDGAEERVKVRRPGCSESFNVVDAPMRAAGSITDGQVGASKLMLMRSSKLVQITADLMQSDPAALLCAEGECVVCDEARRMVWR